MSTSKDMPTEPRVYPPPDDDSHGDDEMCWNCGGEGVVYVCHTEYACIDPESGCDLCERQCDICQPRKRRTPA